MSSIPLFAPFQVSLAFTCPSCLTGGIGTGYIMAFIVCGLFFVIAAGALFWSSRSGRLDNLEDSKFAMLGEEEV